MNYYQFDRNNEFFEFPPNLLALKQLSKMDVRYENHILVDLKMRWNEYEVKSLQENWIPEKTGILKLGKVHWYCKLKANCLFYFEKGRDPKGVLVLENVRVSEIENNGFCIIFPNNQYKFWVDNKRKQKQWIEALNNASYQALMIKRKKLKIEIEKLTKESLVMEKSAPVSPVINSKVNKRPGHHIKPPAKVIPFSHGTWN